MIGMKERFWMSTIFVALFLFFTAIAQADTVVPYNTANGSCTATNADFYIVVSASEFHSGNWLKGFNLYGGSVGKEFVAHLSETNSTSTRYASATTTSTNNGNYYFYFPEYTKTNGTPLLIFIDNLGYNTTYNRDNSGTRWYFSTTIPATCQGYAPVGWFQIASTTPTPSGSTTTIPLYIPNPIDRLESMECTYTSTSTECTPTYASTTTPVTPTTLTLIFIWAFFGFMIGYWVVKKLT